MKKEVTVALDEFADQCACLLDEVAKTGEEVVVTREGKPLVHITAEASAGNGRPSLAHYVRSIRLIVATALDLDCRLVTRDARVIEAGLAPILEA